MVSFPAASPKHPPFFLFFLNPNKPYCVLFRVLCDTLHPKKRHSLVFVTYKKTHFFGGGMRPLLLYNQERSFCGALCRSGPPLPRLKNLFLSQARASFYDHLYARANKAAGYYRPFVFVLFVFVSSLEEDKEEDKDEKEGFGVSLGVVRV